MKKCTLFSLTSFVSSALLVVALFLLTSGIASAATSSPTPHSSHTTLALSRITIIPGPSRLRRVSPKTFFSPHPGPFVVTGRCLDDTLTAFSPADNVVDALAETVNNCPGFVNGQQSININTSCPGLGGGGFASFTLRLAAGTVADNSFGIDAGCVVCEYTNGVHTGETFPGFTLFLNQSSNGTFIYHNGLFHTSSNGSSTSVRVSNNGRFAPLCPPTD